MCLKKILPSENWVGLTQYAAQRHANRIPVMFTVGVFDEESMYVGLNYLGRAKFLYKGALIVGVESDEYVESQGFERPIMSQDERAGIVAGLDRVDAVIIVGGDAREALLRHVRPTIMIYRETEDLIRQDEFQGDLEILNAQGGKYVILPKESAFPHTLDIIQLVEMHA